MTALTRVLAACALGLLPLQATAQDTNADETPPAAEQPAPVAEPGTTAETDDTPAPAGDDTMTPAPGGALATGETLGAAPEAAGASEEPPIYVRETHGDFEVRCLRAADGQEDPCQLFQRLEDQQGNPTADVNFFDLPDGAELAGGATIITPLSTLLTAQVTLSIDGGQARRYPFAFCDGGGCYARLGFTADDIARFRRGAMARIVVVPALAPDQPAELDLSLRGFTAGYSAVEVDG
ncbi:invasion associated locus B family protein [Jannaschia sp. W003]|uniref:invasion associated locus B family protein n=1 Tax=Jannaschia sp. W003 TaxID=2867012 RepID=UPI0021A3CB67|nr:invasion associated locus B family protein [Jannaschia sp. W003]UWQ20261.1 invasion associated locus B family protein [Jannaschia sp. W003]